MQLDQPGVTSTPPEGATILDGNTGVLDFTAQPGTCMDAQPVHVIGITRRSGWEKTTTHADGSSTYESDTLDIDDGSLLGEGTTNPSKRYRVSYGLRQQLTRETNAAGQSVTTAHVEKWWLLIDKETWRGFRFSQKYDLVSSPWSVTYTTSVKDCVNF